MKEYIEKLYEAPVVEVIEVNVEKGFASSYDLDVCDEDYDSDYSIY